jgi:branched-chain amino acid transport system substrate-binding protein
MKKMFSVFMLIGVMLGYNAVEAAEPIRVGLISVRSGPFKTDGDRYVRTVEAAFREINKAGGVLGRPLELLVEDHQMKPDRKSVV